MPDPEPAPQALPSAQPSPWRLRLLGGFELDNGSQRLTRLRSRAATLLLARLALAPTRSHAREELCDMLWPEAPAVLGRSRLRQTLSILRALLEPPGSAPVLQAEQRVLRLLPGALWCDGVAFESAARQGDTAQALRCYGGELLPGFYDDWVQEERLRLAALAERLSRQPHTPIADPAAVVAPQPNVPAPTVSSWSTLLPSYWTRAFGLTPTLERLRARLASERLVTVHGPGGSGKTRLVVELAQTLRSSSPPDFARVEFVALLACTSTEQALEAICQALRAEGTGDAQARLLASLDSGRTLLVLDNAEQLVADHLGEALVRLLTALPALHVLVSSRRVFDVAGESAFALEGLLLPAASASAAAATGNPALELFVARARAARVDFHLGARHHAQAVVELVRLLAGMPLAIELAASRMRSLSASELLQRMRDDAGSPMLAHLARSQQRASPDARHASMRHTIAWSWQQLAAEQVQVLQVLTLPKVPARLEAVAALVGNEVAATQRQLDELVAASLVLVVDGADGAANNDGCARYSVLQPVREFAAETLGAEAAHRARQRLRRWLIGFARACARRSTVAIAPDVALLDFAIASAPGDDDHALALQLAQAVRLFWHTALPSAAALRALEQSLPAATEPNQVVQTHELLAYVFLMQGQTAQALLHADAAINVACDDIERGQALARWCWVRYGAGLYDSDFDSALAEGWQVAQRSGDLRTQGRVLFMQTVVACDLRQQFDLAEQLVAQRHLLWTRLGDTAAASAALLHRAVVWAHQGRMDQAIATATECETVLRGSGNATGLAFATSQLARIYLMARRCDDAAAAFRRSIQLAWTQHLAQYLSRALMHLPNALAAGTDPVVAARLHGFGSAHYRRHFGAPNRIEARELCRTRRLLRQRLGIASFEARLVEGGALTMAQAVALALAEPA
jgi:predicted ATPase